MNSTVKNKEKLQNTKKIKGILKRFSILTLSFVFLLMSFNFSFAIDDLSTLLSYNSNITKSGTSDSFTLSSAYFQGTSIICSSGQMSCSLTRTNSQSKNYILSFPNAASVTFSNLVNCSNSGNTLNIDSGVSSCSFDVTFSNTTLVTVTTGGNGSATYTFEYLKIDDNEYVDNTVIPIKYPYTFQNGYLFVYDLGNTGAMYSFDLTSKSEEYSNLGDYPFPDTNQSYWFSNSLPEIDETTIPDSNATNIHWLKGEKQNIFGQTQDMIATISGTSTGRYLYIYNPPAHYKWVGSSNPTASETINYPVTINGVSSGDNFYIFDSVARLADYNQGGKVQGTVGEVGYGSVASDGAITVNTSDGAIFNQVSGGSTDISGANGGSISENINGLKQTLDDFVNQFIQLLSAPISHIQQLIQSSHQFFDVFSQLFEWLPSELSSVIVSGLIIMVVIGVIKMLL